MMFEFEGTLFTQRDKQGVLQVFFKTEDSDFWVSPGDTLLIEGQDPITIQFSDITNGLTKNRKDLNKHILAGTKMRLVYDEP